MKKTLLTLALVAGCSAAAFAQGKITVGTDVLTSLVTFGQNMYPGDSALAGLAVPTDLNSLPSHIHLVFGLYAGQTSGSLSLQTVLSLNAAGGTGQQDGSPAPTHATLGWTGLTYMQVRIWDGAYASYEAAQAAAPNDYFGQGTEFSMTPGTSIAYPNIWNGGGSTWAPGAIIVQTVPEPATFALAGLGAAALLIFRRRK